MISHLEKALTFVFLALGAWVFYELFVQPRKSPLKNLPGPESPRGFGLGGHLNLVLNTSTSKQTHEEFVKRYGRNVRIKGIGNHEDRLLTTDPVALAYVMNHTNEFQKPWQSRRVITRLIGEGMLAAEGQTHKRMRRIGTAAFSVQNMRAFVPVTFRKANELKEKWEELIENQHENSDLGRYGAKVDICHWISRATFDVIGVAGFDYNFSAIQHETNELFQAYKDMFEIAVSRKGGLWDMAIVYFPWLELIFRNEKTLAVLKSQEIINRVGGQIIREKTRRIQEGDKNGSGYDGIDFLSLLIKSNLSESTPLDQHISDRDLLANVNTFFFAGSDTTSLALTWIIYLLSAHSKLQDRLRTELKTFLDSHPHIPSISQKFDWDETWSALDELPFLNNVIREALRIIPPVHSSIRVAMRDDDIPTRDAVKMRDGTVRNGVKIRKGQFVHIPVECMNTDKGVWGEDAWLFNPDRWDNLPSAVLDQPGLYNHLLSFSAGPRSCIGMRFSVIEMKCFLLTLVSNFCFERIERERVVAANVVLTRPYVAGKFMDGSQCPLLVSCI